jgi:PQQ-like domain
MQMGAMRRGFVLVVALVLSGCWLQPGWGPGRQNSNPFENRLTAANVGSLEQAWSASVEDVFGSQPLVTGSAVYSGAMMTVGGQPSLTVRALAGGSGAQLWQRDLPTLPPPFGAGALLSVSGDVLTTRLHSTAGFVFETLDSATGATIGTVTESEFLDPATVAVDDRVIAYRAVDPGLSDYNLVVRSRDTFELLWTSPIAPFAMGSGDVVVFADGQIYLEDRDEDSQVIRAFAVDGCGSPTCSPTWTAEIPPPEDGYDELDAQILAASDDQVLLRRSASFRGGFLRTDLVALTRDGAPDWTVPMFELDGVAVAGDTVFATGRDAATPEGSRTLLARSASGTWRADVSDPVSGTPMVAGGLVYVEDGVTDGTDVRVFAADGCGSPSCPELAVVDTGPGTGGLYGMSAAVGALFVSKAGPGAKLICFAPTG